MTAGPGAPRPIRVLLVEDSEASRTVLRRILEGACCGARVVGAAADGEEALRAALALLPDLVLLDLQLPRLDGFTFLRLLMARRPTPVVVLSSLARRTDVFKALELGALDFVAKLEEGAPLAAVADALAEQCRMVRALRMENLSAPRPAAEHGVRAGAPLTEPAGVVALGASTGGPLAVQRLLAELPGSLPVGIVVAQHMPERFTGAFADRLSRTTPFSVQEARGEEVVAAGRVLVAPGGRHLEVVRGADRTLRAAVVDADAPRAACPSVDRLFASVARAVGPAACAVLLTGMGRDGCAGMAAVKAAGGLALAESEESAVVYGMPHAAAESGAVDEVLPLALLAGRIARHFGAH
jgi:two-component system chemotaxis response regulator CheB